MAAAHRHACSHYNKRYLIRRLAYRVQELVSGGLSAATRATLATIAQQCPHPASRPTAERTRLPVVGTQLLRRWHGQMYRVEVSPTGFVYAGWLYPSLTAVARAITGSHCSGPAFFRVATVDQEEAQ